LPAFFPNYPVFDQHGNLFFTDSGNWTQQDGRIYVVRPDGTTELAFPDYLGFPNGLALDSDGGWLYFVQSNLPNVARIKISDGELVGRPEIYAEFATTAVPDGIALTESRDLYVAFYDPSVIYVVEPSGRIDVLLEGLAFDLLNRPTNITFSRETTHIYYPNYGTGEIVRLDVGEKGMPLHYPQLSTAK
jgi:gluconolactonase